MRGERIGVGLMLAALAATLTVRAEQPIVENYVGRQIPTAMVARNLDRGSGFWRPTLDTAPFPNRFLVEPPVYAQMVAGLKRWQVFIRDQLGWPADGFVWERSGRWASAAMTTLGATAFYGLARRREGTTVALVALGMLGAMPVVLRYGRAFQPDATMLGFILVGLWGWDEYQATGRARWAWFGGLALAAGLAVKVSAGWVLIPFGLIMTRWPASFRLGAAVAMLIPAFAWYAYAWVEVHPAIVAGEGTGASLASADNAAIWLQTLSPVGWLRFATWEAIGRNLLWRAFSPLGWLLAMAGWTLGRTGTGPTPDRLWWGWGWGVAMAVLALGAKWHHGYYWIVLAPWVAVGIARLLVRLADRGAWQAAIAAGLGALVLAGSGVQAISTWRTPPEWASIGAAGRRIAAVLPASAILIAPEAVLYYADRPGPRLEFNPEAVVRAAGEWQGSIPRSEARQDPLALVRFYQGLATGDPQARFGHPTGPRPTRSRPGYVADVGSVQADSQRLAWRAALRAHPGVRRLIDEPDLFLAELRGVP